MIPPPELSVLLPRGHDLPQAELLRLAARIMGQRGKGKSGGVRANSGRKPKLSPCPKCGLELGVVAMRSHYCARSHFDVD